MTTHRKFPWGLGRAWWGKGREKPEAPILIEEEDGLEALGLRTMAPTTGQEARSHVSSGQSKPFWFCLPAPCGPGENPGHPAGAGVGLQLGGAGGSLFGSPSPTRKEVWRMAQRSWEADVVTSPNSLPGPLPCPPPNCFYNPGMNKYSETINHFHLKHKGKPTGRQGRTGLVLPLRLVKGVN